MRCPKCSGERLGNSGTAESGRRRWRCNDCGHRTTSPVPDDTVFADQIPKADRYVITAAQNATPIHKGFFESLLQYCKKTKAELIIIPFRYRNPTSQWTKSADESEWWDAAVVPYLYNGRFNLNKSLTILGDTKVQPTAVAPLTGMESITGPRSGIIGHTKIQLTTIPTPNHRLPKIMATTGAVTKDNYSDTKAGKKGEFHHAFGAAVVELTRGGFHLRQINADKDGSFIDLDLLATPEGVKKAPPAEALVMGDSHVEFIDPGVVEATFGENGIVPALKPKRLVWHDLIDFYSRNHHHRNDPILGVIKHRAGKGYVKGELERGCAFVNEHTPNGVESVIVPSNHPEAMARWIRETDWRNDPENAEFYLETALAVVKSAEWSEQGGKAEDPFTYWGKRLFAPGTRILERDESYTVKGIEIGLHGDKGPNGSRGAIKGISRIGVKTIIGHSHSPGIFEGCYQTGTSTLLRLGYNTGPSSWLNTHCVIYANGKRSLINVVKGKYHESN